MPNCKNATLVSGRSPNLPATCRRSGPRPGNLRRSHSCWRRRRGCCGNDSRILCVMMGVLPSDGGYFGECLPVQKWSWPRVQSSERRAGMKRSRGEAVTVRRKRRWMSRKARAIDEWLVLSWSTGTHTPTHKNARGLKKNMKQVVAEVAVAEGDVQRNSTHTHTPQTKTRPLPPTQTGERDVTCMHAGPNASSNRRDHCALHGLCRCFAFAFSRRLVPKLKPSVSQ